ncbi:hypothetical protein NDU88_006810 [Pleurodeles waltl]|uniref:Uncharacterized protein n=1 Tax=Pleurodeles waltl TaxID=8319 RepID=A0AAV7SQZ1_PLEWA|nr:hypothetical protein NDU88_006810 [Pleurodeles waltl]
MRAASPEENPRTSCCEEDQEAGPFTQRRLGRSGPVKHSGVRSGLLLLGGSSTNFLSTRILQLVPTEKPMSCANIGHYTRKKKSIQLRYV